MDETRQQRQVGSDSDEFIRGALPRLLGLARAMTGSHHDAQDLVQETLIKVVDKWGRIDDPEAYARRTLVNTFISGRRRRSSTEVVSHEIVVSDYRGASTSGPEEQTALRDTLARALLTLPNDQRATLALRYYQDLPDAQIAQLMGCSEGTVRMRAMRGMHRLRELVPTTEPVATVGGAR